jgi:hypothetical protein
VVMEDGWRTGGGRVEDVGMNVRGNNIHCSNECMETELQGCYILHVCVKELLAESERAISATVPQCTDSDRGQGGGVTGHRIHSHDRPTLTIVPLSRSSR